MVTRYARIIGLTIVLGAASVPAANAGTHISVQIGVPGPVVTSAAFVPGYPGYVWRPGYYVWTPVGYRWVPGSWVPRGYAYRGWRGERAWEHREREYDHRHWDRDHRNWDRDGRDWHRDDGRYWRR